MLKEHMWHVLTLNSLWGNMEVSVLSSLKKLTVDEVKLLVIILWMNWNESNAVSHGQPATEVR